MDVVRISIDELIPYENNPRLNESAVDYVADSILKFGFRNPILIDKNNVIVAGHTRYLALKKIGEQTADCIVIDDLSDDEIRAFRIADNSVSEFSKFDSVKLRNELLNIKMENPDFEEDNMFDMDICAPETDDEDYPVLGLNLDYSESHSSNFLVKWGGIKIKITDDEYEWLYDSFNDYIERTGESVGFIEHILNNGGITNE